MSENCQETGVYSTIPTTGVFGNVWPSAITPNAPVNGDENEYIIPVLTQGFQGKLSAGGWTKGNEGFPQQTFLGASITNFSINAGFGDSTSTLNVTLVNDEYNKGDGLFYGSGDDVYHNGQSDQFKPPVVGSPVFFKFGKQRATVSQAWLKTYFEKYNGYFVPQYTYPTGEFTGPIGSPLAQLPDGRYIDLEESSDIRYQDLKEDPASATFVYEDQLPPEAIQDANFYPWADLASQVGRPDFDFVGWNHFVFGGILSSFSQKKGGSNTFDVSVSDPREILSNVVLVLNDYQGTTFNNKNMYNIYGFLEYDLEDSFQEFVDGYALNKSVLSKDDKGFFSGSDLYQFSKRAFQEDGFNFNTAFEWGSLPDEQIVQLSGPEYFPITGQGFARRSERGMPLYRITQALSALFSYNGELWGEYVRAGFGGPVDFRGYNYVVDLGGIPFNKIPSMYFIEQNQMDLLSFVQEVTEAISHDYTVSLLPVLDAKPTASLYAQNMRAMKEGRFGDVVTGIIRVDAIDRSQSPKYGAVKEYIDFLKLTGETGASESDKVFVESQNIGYDLSNVTTDKFVVGGQETNMYTFARNKDNLYRQYLKQQSTLEEARGQSSYDFFREESQWRLDTMYKQQVLPFYGFLDKDTPTIPIGFGPFQQILLDSSNVDAVNVGNYYIATEMELRAASLSYSAWSKFLLFYNERYGELTNTPIEVKDGENPEKIQPRADFKDQITETFAPFEGKFKQDVAVNVDSTVEPSEDPIPFDLTDKDVIKTNFEFDAEELTDNGEVRDSQVFSQLTNNPKEEEEQKSKRFWRVDSMSVPRCVYNSSNPQVDEDGLPIDVCQPPYGYPLYYKRAERIGVGGGGYVDILQDIKNVQSGQERLVKEMLEKDPEFGHYAEFRDGEQLVEMIARKKEGKELDEDNAAQDEVQKVNVNFEKYIEKKKKQLISNIFGQDEVPEDASEAKLNKYKEQNDRLQRALDVYRRDPLKYTDQYQNYMAVKKQSGLNGQLASSATKGININLENSKRVYEWIKSVADKHLGKTYLVKMPKNANINYKYKMGPKGLTNGQQAWVDSGPFGFPPLKNIGDPLQPFPNRFKPAADSTFTTALNKENFHHSLDPKSVLDPRLKWTEGALRTSYNPIDGDWEHNYKPEPQGGYFDWNVWSSGLDQRNRIFPQLPDTLTDGYRIKPYVRYDHSQFYDFGSISTTVTEEIPTTARTEDFISDMYNGFAASEFIRKPGDQKDKVLQEKKDNYTYVECSVDEKLYLAPKLDSAQVKVYGQRYVWKNTRLVESQTINDQNEVVDGYTVPPIIYSPGNPIFWEERAFISGIDIDILEREKTSKYVYNIPKTITASGFFYEFASGTKEEIEDQRFNIGLGQVAGAYGFEFVTDYGDPEDSQFGINPVLSDNAIFIKRRRSKNWDTNWIRDLAGGVDLVVEEGSLTSEGEDNETGSIGVEEFYTGYNMCATTGTIIVNLESEELVYDDDAAVREVLEKIQELCKPRESISDDERYEKALTNIVDFARIEDIKKENKVVTKRENLDPDSVYAVVTVPGRVNAVVDGFFADGLKNNTSPIQFANLFSADVVFKTDFTSQENTETNYATPTTARLSGVLVQAVENDIIDDPEDPTLGVNNLSSLIEFFQDEGVQYPFGSPDTKASFTSPSPIMPHLFVLPLMSKERCYGPWLSSVSGIGGETDRLRYRDLGGKVEYVKDESLVPWNYGGYGAMNEVGNLRAQFSNSLQLFTEQGSFTVADAPTGIIVGSPFIGGGPLVTSVAVSVGDGGIKSTINMNLYGNQFGKLTKQKEDQLAKLTRERQKQLDLQNELKRKGIYKSRENNLGVNPNSSLVTTLAESQESLKNYKQNGFKKGETTQNTIVFNGTSSEELVNFVGSGGLLTANQFNYESYVSIQEDGYKQQVETEVDDYVTISIMRQQAAESDLNSMFTGYDESVYNPYMPTKDFIQRSAINRRMRF